MNDIERSALKFCLSHIVRHGDGEASPAAARHLDAIGQAAAVVGEVAEAVVETEQPAPPTPEPEKPRSLDIRSLLHK